MSQQHFTYIHQSGADLVFSQIINKCNNTALIRTCLKLSPSQRRILCKLPNITEAEATEESNQKLQKSGFNITVSLIMTLGFSFWSHCVSQKFFEKYQQETKVCPMSFKHMCFNICFMFG
jgi:hypothetical protein